MIEASLVFTLVFHEHQALFKVKFLCLFLKFQATHQLEGLVPEVRKVLTLSLVMSSCCFNHLEKENRKTLLSDPPTGLQRKRGAMRWQRWAEGPQRHIYWGKGHLEIQAHCREQIRGIIGAEIPSGFILSSPWKNALLPIFCEVTCFFLRKESGRNRWAGNGAGTSQPPNHIIPPEANCNGQTPTLPIHILLFIPDQQTQHSQSTRSWHTAHFFASCITKQGRCLQWLCTFS